MLTGLERMSTREVQDEVPGAGGGIEHAAPGFGGDARRHASLPVAVNAEAEEIAEQVVARGDAAEDVIGPGFEGGGVGGGLRAGLVHR